MSATAVITYTLLFFALYFEVFLLVTFLQQRTRIKTRHAMLPEDTEFPSVTIVVPCFNEAATLEKTLHSLLSINYPKDKMHILIVDDGSQDNTLEIARTYESNPQIRVFHKENGGKHTALNFALQYINTDLIGCLDADSTVHPDALLRIAAVFADPRIAAVTPGIHVSEPETLLQHLQRAEYRLSIFIRYTFAKLGSVFITPGPFSIFRTTVIRELGGWRQAHMTEDMEIGMRMQEAGLAIVNEPNATVYTTTPRTIKKLFHQRVRWSYGFLRNTVDYKHMVGNPQYGNLGVIILPAAIISIFSAVIFAGIAIWEIFGLLFHTIIRIYNSGQISPWEGGFDIFYFNTSGIMMVTYVAVALTIALICTGSLLATGSRRPPAGTILFVLFYGFIAPAWLAAALTRAIFKTGVRWR